MRGYDNKEDCLNNIKWFEGFMDNISYVNEEEDEK
jgi:hypothetical protein